MKKLLTALFFFLFGAVTSNVFTAQNSQPVMIKSDVVDSWSDVKKLKLDLLDQDDLEFLSSMTEFKKCIDPYWMPLEGISENKVHIGVIAEILALVTQQINVPFTLVETEDWSESLDKLASRECDIVTSDLQNGVPPDFYIKTEPFLYLQHVYITQKEALFELDFSEIKNHRIGVPKGYPTIALMNERYGDINFVEVQDINEGVLWVSQGKLFAFIDILPVISYSIEQQGLTNLKVAGHLDLNLPTVMAVRSDMPELVQILNKVFSSMNQTISNQLLSQWVKIEYDVKVDWSKWIKYVLLLIFVMLLIIYWNNKLRTINTELDDANKKLASLSETDGLTQLQNRHFLNRRLPTLIDMASRNNTSMAVAILDIDHFKQINDHYGHAIGDDCLVEFSKLIKTVFKRDTDCLVRFGGEEFLVICFGIKQAQFATLLERLRFATENFTLPISIIKDGGRVGEHIGFTISSGYTFCSVAPNEDIENLVSVADQHLYKAKNNGRNRIVGFEFNER
ncbi:GGDEF domain-containing protein [Moritella sp. 24]|uniref:transporter substrate-binding domain-containing diguanylate cyclase n=1 Tax=Moritella sp. 24 TaxID=2746230 RepID=UPI001BAA048F|nr:GGDEF domain-containing protein [Moritella sp. 24]QUM75604.1 GGDEF domain-containing protein [Moritella sp. 24]